MTNTERVVEFVGGPADGERTVIRDGIWTVELPDADHRRCHVYRRRPVGILGVRGDVDYFDYAGVR